MRVEIPVSACSRKSLSRSFIILPLLMGMAIAGCSAPKAREEAVFFPFPPNKPRVQFLGSISNSTDVEGVRRKFSLFVFGKKEADRVKTIKKPYGVATYKGKIYVSDTGAARIAVIDPLKKTFGYLQVNSSAGRLRKPVNLCIDDSGRLYVSDTERKEVVVFRENGEFVTALGGDLDMKPADVAVDDKFLYVLDMKHYEIKLFERETGKLLRSIGKGSAEAEGLNYPTNLALDADGFIYVTNAGNGKVIKLDRDGHILAAFGKLGDGFGQFGRPKGISIDREQRIFVADGAHQNVQIFNAEGRLLLFFGNPGLPLGSMNLPADVYVTTDNLEHFQKLADPSFELEQVILVTNQFGNSKLSIYGLGRQRDNAAKADAR